ncbi:hypothetical protein Tel_00525 [Candidatus Tenderia electrophaga]|uniref:Uncharacterized protein n=1 Tax=Candidatus Tenderia electrophaga TaxID=1748243 RepID=A0A0S2T9H3_9GAMM|nr:hypothetical protein Tel_00525 [Candidatus Tenderia electrophaga]
MHRLANCSRLERQIFNSVKHFYTTFIREGIMAIFSIGMLVPLTIFFGLTVVLSAVMAGTALKNIEHKKQPD